VKKKILWTLRLAYESDVPALDEMIPLSARVLQAAHYTPPQIEAALGPIFGVDRRLIRDGAYFVAVSEPGLIVGCGGWSKRRSLYGSDAGRPEDAFLDVRHDPARIRAFFVHPDWARQGIGCGILATCEAAIVGTGFRTVELVAALPGEPLYASSGYEVVQRYELSLPNELTLPVVRMTKTLTALLAM